MKNKKKGQIKDSLKEFSKEFFTGFLLIIIILVLFLVGLIFISVFPEKVSKIFSEFFELVVLIGFFVLLAVLYAISKIIYIVRKIKEKSSNNNGITKEEK